MFDTEHRQHQVLNILLAVLLEQVEIRVRRAVQGVGIGLGGGQRIGLDIDEGAAAVGVEDVAVLLPAGRAEGGQRRDIHKPALPGFPHRVVRQGAVEALLVDPHVQREGHPCVLHLHGQRHPAISISGRQGKALRGGGGQRQGGNDPLLIRHAHLQQGGFHCRGHAGGVHSIGMDRGAPQLALPLVEDVGVGSLLVIVKREVLVLPRQMHLLQGRHRHLGLAAAGDEAVEIVLPGGEPVGGRIVVVFRPSKARGPRR